MRIELGKGKHRIRLMSSLADVSQGLDEFGRHIPVRQFVKVDRFEVSHGISISSDEVMGGSVSVQSENEMHDYGDEVVLRAIPDDGFAFLGWGARSIESKSEKITITLTDHLSLRPLLLHLFLMMMASSQLWEIWLGVTGARAKASRFC